MWLGSRSPFVKHLSLLKLIVSRKSFFHCQMHGPRRGVFGFREIRPLKTFGVFFVNSRACSGCPAADTPPVSCNEVISQVFRCLHRVLSRRLTVLVYAVMRSPVFLGLSADLPTANSLISTSSPLLVFNKATGLHVSRACVLIWSGAS